MSVLLRSRFGLAAAAAAGLGAAAAWLPTASASPSRHAAAADEPLQILADVVLIEAQCRRFAVDYGKLFAFAEQNGIRPVEIMPTGARRAAFDAAYRRRAQERQGDGLCVDLAAERAAAVPGIFLPR
jgi:hypothetical protein